MFDVRKLTLFSNLYKLFAAEACPKCKVSIVRTGGCKFMECTKCKYQFCWYCLDEFYTEYHYNLTDCPFRYCFFHTIEVFALVLLVLKMAVMSTWFLNSIYLVALTLKTVAIHCIFLAQSAFIQKELKKIEVYRVMHAEGAARLRGRIYISQQD